MNTKIKLIKEIAKEFRQEWTTIAAFIEVESGNVGFSPKTGKIIIQFEPIWFRRHAPYAPSGRWSVNKVERQKQEWRAFNNAFHIDPEAAMKSASIGIGQIMGLHYTRLGYSTVGEMWDDAKRGVDRQVWQICKFIATDRRLLDALKNKNWHKVATYYNGAKYMEIAKKYHRKPYNESLKEAYLKYLKYED